MTDVTVEKETSRGIPKWVVTFADLMTLLMCFFVLLLSFSEMDKEKFKQMSGSMKDAFGVQADIEVRAIPKGTSLITYEFTPGVPEQSLINDSIRQFTINDSQSTLDAVERQAREIRATEDHGKQIREALREEIENGSVSVQTEGMKVIIHIHENASFDSGYADVRPEFLPVLTNIAGLISGTNGIVNISGHTDNVPISNDRFRSNWELSTSRAVSVAHELMKTADVEPENFIVTGHADTKPRAGNDNSENRAKNRRVDISIVRGNQLDTTVRLSIDEALNSGADFLSILR